MKIDKAERGPLMKFGLLIFLLLPVLLAGETLSYTIDNSAVKYDKGNGEFILPSSYDWNYTVAPESYRLPVRTVNIILPSAAENVVSANSVLEVKTLAGKEPKLNTPYSDGERILTSKPSLQPAEHVIFQGTSKWGSVIFARFAVLPVLYNFDMQAFDFAAKISLSVSYQIDKKRENSSEIVPELLTHDPSFVNPEMLSGCYSHQKSRLYDCLIVSTPSLYNAASALVNFRQGQGLVTSFADINQILVSSGGTTPADKLRNFLIGEYVENDFTYLLLIGDIDTVPIAYLTPEPNGSETVPSDFYYSDLSSDFDSDQDGLLGEYETGMDYTPELFVGRIPWNNPSVISTVCARIVAFEQANLPWKHKALLPGAILNYYNEDGGGQYERTDGAVFMEYCKNTALRNFETTTLYEQSGLLPSLPSDFPLNYTNFSNLINSQSWGIVNWSAHGSSNSSVRKVWTADDNGNFIPESSELNWYPLVENSTFDLLANQDGSVYFCASCNNGMLDNDSPCLGEWLIRQKAVADIAATRTGWYKLGWQNPGWGGLSSYNYHFLENYASAGMTVGQAHGFANWLHTQYCLFGDPADTGGIIWPELQNIYTYLLFGDPAVGYPPANNAPAGSILVWEPFGNNGNTLIQGLLDLAPFNVVYTDHLIDTYDYLNQFNAVFCLFGLGYGENNYAPQTGSYEYNYLLGYLQQGGKVYLEGMVNWDPSDSLFGRFGTIAPFDHLAFIERLRYERNGIEQIWNYNGYNGGTQALLAYGDTAQPIFWSENTEHVNDVIGVWNRIGSSRTLSSSFEITGVCSDLYPYTQFLAMVLDTLDVYHTAPVHVSDNFNPPLSLLLNISPNPFSHYVKAEVKSDSPVTFSIYNLKGQLVQTAKMLPSSGKVQWQWNGKNNKGTEASSGLYFIRADNGRHNSTAKLLKLN